MPDISFKGASNFAITGGNFNDVAGNVTTFNFGSSMEGIPQGLLTTLANSNQTNQPRAEPERIGASRRTQRIRSVPPSNEAGSHFSSSPQPSSSRPINTPSPSYTQSSFESDSEVESGVSSPPSRRSTPPTDVEEYQRNGAPAVSSPDQQNVDLLTPLTNTLGLRRFTPATYLEPLPTIREAPYLAPAPKREALSPLVETPEFGLQLPSTSSHFPSSSPVATVHSLDQTSPVSYPASSVSHASYQGEFQGQEMRSPRGPPPPIPPRPGALSPTSPAVLASLPPLSTTPAAVKPVASPTLLTPPLTEVSPGVSRGLEDPSARFARLQAQRPSTKGYASGLSSPSSQTATAAYSPSVNALSPPPPPPLSTRSLSEYSNIATPPYQQQPLSPNHAMDIRSGGSDRMSSGENQSERPPVPLAPQHQGQYQAHYPQYHQHYRHNDHQQLYQQPQGYDPTPRHPSHPNHPAQLANSHGNNSHGRYWASQPPLQPFGFHPVANPVPFPGLAFAPPGFSAQPFAGPAFGGAVFGGGSTQGFW